jgi:hypothetical protein
MPKAYQVYQRVLQVGRVFLNRPKADDREVASSLLELDQANFALFAREVGINSSKHLRYTGFKKIIFEQKALRGYLFES